MKNKLLFHGIFAAFALVISFFSDLFSHPALDIVRWVVVGTYFLFCIGDAYREAIFSRTTATIPHRLFLNPIMALSISIPAVIAHSYILKFQPPLVDYALSIFCLTLIVFHGIGLLGTYFLASINRQSRAKHDRIPIWFEVTLLIAIGMLFRFAMLGQPLLSSTEIAVAEKAIGPAATYVKSDSTVGYFANRSLFLIMDPQGFIDYTCTTDCPDHALTSWHIRIPHAMYAFILLIGMYSISIEFFKRNSIALATTGLAATSAYVIAVSRTFSETGVLLDIFLLAQLYTFFSYIPAQEKRKIVGLALFMVISLLISVNTLPLALTLLVIFPLITKERKVLTTSVLLLLVISGTALAYIAKSQYGGIALVANDFMHLVTSLVQLFNIDAMMVLLRESVNALGAIFVLIISLIIVASTISFFASKNSRHFYHVLAIIIWTGFSFFVLPLNMTIPLFLLIGFSFYYLEKLEKPRGAAMMILTLIMLINALYAYNTFFGEHSFRSNMLHETHHTTAS